MLAELSIIPLGPEVNWSDQLAEVLKLVDASGLAYQLTPSGTCIEGNWDEVMTLVRRCHDRVRQSSARVVTTIKIEDEEGVNDQLTRNVISVEEKVGHALRRSERQGVIK
ncbi:MAG: MTH1187 family thiamine-binding protein [Planctomycetaceae bacterium]